MPFTLLLSLASFIIFILILIKERRTLLSGFFALLTLGLFGVHFILTLEQKDLFFNNPWAVGIIVSISLLLLFFPTLSVITLIIQGIQLLKKEGFSFRNLLSLMLGLGLIINALSSGFIRSTFEEGSFIFYLHDYLNLLLGYLIVFSLLYTVSSFINFINFKRQSLDYVVVLGAGLNGDQVTPLLASRIRKGIAVYQQQKNAKLIMSGGQGEDELISEAEAMKQYAVAQGIHAEDILIENQSTNTQENILFSKKLMPEHATFALVTNHYHLFRALLIAQQEKIKCIGYGARTKFYFSLNAFIREIIGYLYVKRRFHAIMISILSGLYILSKFVLRNF